MIIISLITDFIEQTEVYVTDLPTTNRPATTIIDESDSNIYGNDILSTFYKTVSNGEQTFQRIMPIRIHY